MPKKEETKKEKTKKEEPKLTTDERIMILEDNVEILVESCRAMAMGGMELSEASAETSNKVEVLQDELTAGLSNIRREIKVDAKFAAENADRERRRQLNPGEYTYRISKRQSNGRWGVDKWNEHYGRWDSTTCDAKYSFYSRRQAVRGFKKYFGIINANRCIIAG